MDALVHFLKGLPSWNLGIKPSVKITGLTVQKLMQLYSYCTVFYNWEVHTIYAVNILAKNEFYAANIYVYWYSVPTWKFLFSTL